MNMTHADAITLLKAASNPDFKVLLDDGEFNIEHNCNYPLDRGNGFLQRICRITMVTPGGFECLGSYELKINGKWHVDVTAPYEPSTDSDCRFIGEFDGRDEAIAALWLARHEAYSTHN